MPVGKNYRRAVRGLPLDSNAYATTKVERTALARRNARGLRRRGFSRNFVAQLLPELSSEILAGDFDPDEVADVALD